MAEELSVAEKYRRKQAQHLLENLLVETNGGKAVLAFWPVTDDTGREGYVPFEEVLENPEYMLQVMESASKELRAWLEKYGPVARHNCDFDDALCEIGNVAKTWLADVVEAARDDGSSSPAEQVQEDQGPPAC